METHVVIMAGGVGSRFWPMSTSEYPKQFIDVLGCGKSLLRLTFERFLPLCPPGNIWVVTSAAYESIVRSQLPELPAQNILGEPCARNTAPCIAWAGWKIAARDPGANIIVTPSDALVLDAQEYRKVISEALDFTVRGGKTIVTVGIKPTRPETGYGYICSGAPAAGAVLAVDSFKEKPSLEVARQYLAAGNYFWNAGIFVWNVSTLVSSMRRHAQQIAAVMDSLAPSFYTEVEKDAVEKLFPECEKISIDYAVMEKASNIFTIPGDFGWSDLGTWGSLLQNMGKDSGGNASVGHGVHLYDCKDSIVHVSDLSVATICGLDGYIVAERGGRLLICPLSEEQRIRDFEKD